MLHSFLFGNVSPWVPPTVRLEYLAIPDLEKRERHNRWVKCHLQDQDLRTPIDVVMGERENFRIGLTATSTTASSTPTGQTLRIVRGPQRNGRRPRSTIKPKSLVGFCFCEKVPRWRPN
jgi:hypothetical protein